MILLERYYLYRVELADGARDWLIRSWRPEAPNPSQPACTLANMIAEAKAETLLRSALAELGQPAAAYTLLGDASDYEGAPELGLHGLAELSLWLIADRPTLADARKRVFVGAPADADAEQLLRRQVDEEEFERYRSELPPRHRVVRLITEADYDLLDCEAFVVDDVMWLEQAYGRRWLDEGPGAWTHARKPTPTRTQAELDASRRAPLERYIAELRAAQDFHGFAFELIPLVVHDRDAVIAYVDELVAQREQVGESWDSVCYAISRAAVRDATRLQLERWRERPAYADVVAAIDEAWAEECEWAQLDDE